MIDWDKYDSKNEFTIFEAACLLLEIEPTQEIEKEPPVQVIEMVGKIEILAGMVDNKIQVLQQPVKRQPGTVSRDYLFEIAPKVIKEPAFLFPEVRKEEILHGSERNSWMKLVAALLEHANIDIQTVTAGQLKLIVEQSPYGSLDEGNLNGKLERLKSLPQKPEKTSHFQVKKRN